MAPTNPNSDNPTWSSSSSRMAPPNEYYDSDSDDVDVDALESNEPTILECIASHYAHDRLEQASLLLLAGEAAAQGTAEDETTGISGSSSKNDATATSSEKEAAKTSHRSSDNQGYSNTEESHMEAMIGPNEVVVTPGEDGAAVAAVPPDDKSGKGGAVPPGSAEPSLDHAAPSSQPNHGDNAAGHVQQQQRQVPASIRNESSMPGAFSHGPNQTRTTRRQSVPFHLFQGVQLLSDNNSAARETLATALPVSDQDDEEPPVAAANPVDLDAQRQRKAKVERDRMCHRKTARILAILAMMVFIGGIILSIVVAVTIGSGGGNNNKEHSNADHSSPLGEESGQDGNGSSGASNIDPMASTTAAMANASDSIPTVSPTTLASIVPDLPRVTLQALEYPISPQFRALEWLSMHPQLPDMPDWRKRQLMALATLYYTLQGEEWLHPVRDDWMDYERSECDWYSSSFTEFGFNHMTHKHFLVGLNNNATVCDEEGRFHTLNMTVPIFGGNFGDDGLQLPPELTLMADSLQHCQLITFGSGQRLEVMIPPFFEQLTNLKTINYNWNNFTGTIPERMFDYHLPLQMLDLSQNLVNGTIPSRLGTLSDTLDWLNLRRTFVFGSIPSELYQATHLTFMDLIGNQLKGTLSDTITDLQDLRHLELSGNAFSGVMPPGLFNMTNLEVLSVGGNLLEGNIPSTIDQMTNLRVLSLGSRMHVRDPLSWKTFEVGPNLFTGTIPTALFGLTNLEVLSLSGNSLKGFISTSVGTMTKLRVLDWSDNELVYGSIPSEIGQLSLLKILSLRGASVTGSVPMEVCNLPNLTVLEVHCDQVFCDCNCTCV